MLMSIGYAKKHYRDHDDGVVKTTVKETGQVVKTTGKAAGEVVEGTGKAVGGILNKL